MTPFVGEERRETADLLTGLYDQVLADSTPRMICLVAESGWGKTRIVQEFYGFLQRERQPQGTYWPPELDGEEPDPMRSRKMIYPELVMAPTDTAMPWLWWGLRCEQVSSGRKLRALLNDGVQLKAHLAALIEVAERRKGNRDLALSILGETMAFLPGVGQIASIASAAHSIAPQAWKRVSDAFKAGQDRRRVEQEPRIVDLGATSAPEVNAMVELVKQFVSPDLPLVLAIDDAHAADPDTVEFVRRILTLKAPILVICTAWPSSLEDQLDEEREIEPGQRRTFGGFLEVLSGERPETVIRHDLSPLPDEALAELVTAVAPKTQKESLRTLVDSSGGNPLVLRLNLTSARVQRSISSDAITLSPSELQKLPRAFGRIIGERFEELAEADQLWLGQAALQGFEFLPSYIVAPGDGLDLERIGGFARLPGEGQAIVGRFIEPAVHQAILDEFSALMSGSEKEEWTRATLAALQDEPMKAATEEEGGRTWCMLLLQLAEESVDRELPNPKLVSRAAYDLSFIERDLGLHGGELAAAKAAARWAADDPDGSVRALRSARWAAALMANNEPEEAVRKAREALALIEASESPSSSNLVTVMYVLAKAHLQDQTPNKARDVSLAARDLADDPGDRITALEVVAEAQHELGEIEGGRKALAEALEIARGLQPPDPEVVLELETELIQISPFSGTTEQWEDHLSKIEAELGKDHILYTVCSTQIVHHHLLDGNIEKATSELPKLRASVAYEPNTVIEALSDVLSGGSLSPLQDAFRNLAEAPYNSRNETALFSQIGSAIGANLSSDEPIDGPYDFMRRARLNLSEALEWLLEQFRHHPQDWDEYERLFAVQAGATHLGEYLLQFGAASPISAELFGEVRRTAEAHPLPLFSAQIVQSYADAVAILAGQEVDPIDEKLPPLLQIRALALRAVAAAASGDMARANGALEDANSRMGKKGAWPSRKLVLAAAEKCSSPLCAKGWLAVPDLEFDSDDERLEAQSGLGSWLYRRKRYREAAAVERQVLEEKIRAAGPKSPETVTARANLAITLFEGGQLEEARDLYRDLVGDRKETLGDTHPQTADAKRQLARAMIGVGDFESALPIQEELTEKSSTLNDQERLAAILEGIDKPEAAKPVRDLILKRWIEEAGEDDDRTLQTMVESIENLRKCKTPDRAHSLGRALMEARLRTDGPYAASTHAAKLLLASVCLEAGKTEEAARLKIEVVDSRTEVLGATHPLTIEAKASLGATLYGREEFSAARKEESEVLEARRHQVLQARVNAALAASALAETLAKMDGGIDEAEPLLREAVGEIRSIVGDAHPETARVVSLLVNLHLEAGNVGAAREVAATSLQILERELGPDDPATAAAADRLASVEDRR